MALADDVSQQMKDALRAKQQRRLAALRSIRAAFVNEMKRDGSETLADDICMVLLRRLEKQRKESIEAFERAGREERADAEREELTVIQGFLPSLADQLADAIQGKRHVEIALDIARIDVQVIGLDRGRGGVRSQPPPAGISLGGLLALHLHVEGGIASHRESGGGEQCKLRLGERLANPCPGNLSVRGFVRNLGRKDLAQELPGESPRVDLSHSISLASCL
jgi:uncharacterized protein YqeY